MKSGTTHSTGILSRSLLLVGVMLMVALVPVAVMAQLAANPTPVNLGTAGNYVVLTKTGISTTGTTHITGDMGVSPITATAITGFGLIMDASTTFSTSALVTGRIYAASYTAPTPATMTTAISDMQTAFTAAAGQAPSTGYTELYAGDLSGKTLTRGVYKWGTGVLVNSTGVTVTGTSTDVWIFQIAGDLTLSSTGVTLGGAARAANIFWQVSGKVTIGTNSAMHGIILCQTNIAINTGASLNGRALAQTAVTLDANAVTDPGAASAGSNMPTISGSSYNAATANPGSVGVKVTVTGTNFVAGVTMLDFGAGVTVNNPVVVSATSMTASLTLSPTATPGVRTITVTNSGSGGGSATLTSGFTVGTGAATSVELISSVPSAFALDQNYPNPFNPTTHIQYSLAKATHVSLKIYNLLGNEVGTLVNEYQEAGTYTASFGASTGTLGLTSGVYFYRLEAGSFVSTKKLILMK